MTTDTLIIEGTEKTYDALHQSTVYNLAQHAYEKFNGRDRAGMFNRYTTADKQGKAACFLVYFENNSKATVMTWDEAMSIPTLAAKCKEIWRDK